MYLFNKPRNSFNLYYDFLQSKSWEVFIIDKSCTDIFKLRQDPWFQLNTDFPSVVSMVVKTWINDLKIIFRPFEVFCMDVVIMKNPELPVWTVHAI